MKTISREAVILNQRRYERRFGTQDAHYAGIILCGVILAIVAILKNF